MSVLVTFYGEPAAVFPDLESAECALLALPGDADEEAQVFMLPGQDCDLCWIWRRLRDKAAGPVSEANRPPVTLLSNGNKFR